MTLLKQFAFAAIVSMAVVGCARDNERANQTGTPGAAGTAGTADTADRDFIEDITKGNQGEIVLGQLAEEKATNPSVREFAQMMVRDHTKAGDEFKQVLTRANAQVPTVSTDDINDERERLAKLSGAEFDREYIKKMVDDHETTVDKVRDEAENGKNADVKQWASKTLPTLQQHLDRAKEIQGMLDKQGK